MSRRGTVATRRAGRPAGPQPLYHALYVHLKQRLIEGGLADDRPLPSEPALAASYGVSRVTVRRTLELLEGEGLVRRVRGVGTFAVAKPVSGPRNISGLLENLITFEQGTTAETLGFAVVTPTGPAARALGPEPCTEIRRLRHYHGEPISLTILHVPAALAVHIDPAAIGSQPIIRALEQHGVIAARAEQTLSAVAADAEASARLQVPLGAPLIVMRRTMFDADNRPLLHQESLYAPDRFEYRMTLSRVAVGPAARWTPVG